jgi:CRP/FNR family transcriptional regulator, cyclic AMP receptor protein
LRRSAVDLLGADPDLAETLPATDQERLRRVLRVPVFSVERGKWGPRKLEPGSIGLLVLRGLVMRRLSFGVVASAELVGQGDILRPGDEGPPEAPPHSSAWRVLADVELAVIDRRATALIGRFPELSGAIAGRLLRRSRRLAYLMAAQHLRRVDDALLATLWHIAAMWGKVTLDGVVVPYHFTHQELADIVGARRPSVTVAIRALEAQGRLRREERGRWVLLGDPPEWNAREAFARRPSKVEGALRPRDELLSVLG